MPAPTPEPVPPRDLFGWIETKAAHKCDLAGGDGGQGDCDHFAVSGEPEGEVLPRFERIDTKDGVFYRDTWEKQPVPPSAPSPPEESIGEQVRHALQVRLGKRGTCDYDWVREIDAVVGTRLRAAESALAEAKARNYRLTGDMVEVMKVADADRAALESMTKERDERQQRTWKDAFQLAAQIANELRLPARYDGPLGQALVPFMTELAAARQEREKLAEAELERCCRALCSGCHQGAPEERPGWPGLWHHIEYGMWSTCAAKALRVPPMQRLKEEPKP